MERWVAMLDLEILASCASLARNFVLICRKWLSHGFLRKLLVYVAPRNLALDEWGTGLSKIVTFG